MEVRLRGHHDEALGLDVFLALGRVALACGTVQPARASGFLAVFAWGLALRRGTEPSSDRTAPLARPKAAAGHPNQVLSSQLAHASAARPSEALWFVPPVRVALRPPSVWVGIVGERLQRSEAAMAG